MNINILSTGRLGNFLIKIKNAIHIALYYNYNVILPKHNFFNSTYLIINKSITIEAKQITDKYQFFHRDKIENINKSIFDENTDKVINIIKDIFIFKNIQPLESNDLVIHIRSGDLFIGTSPHPKYLSPPLSYYEKIIENNSYNNIYLIAEDTLNPCINKLLELYPRIIFKLQNLEQDIKLILSATNVVISIGTFVSELLSISDNVKNVYLPNYCNFKKLGVKNHLTDLSEYYKLMIPWKNTLEQKKKMLEY